VTATLTKVDTPGYTTVLSFATGHHIQVANFPGVTQPGLVQNVQGRIVIVAKHPVTKLTT